MTKKQARKNCSACRKISCGAFENEPAIYGKNWYCKHHKKYLNEIEVCNVEKFKRICCPICGDITDGRENDCICKGDPQWRKRHTQVGV